MNRPKPEQGIEGGETVRILNLIALEEGSPPEPPLETDEERLVYRAAFMAGMVAGALFVDLAYNQVALESAEHRADTDDLTGLFNRDYLIDGFSELQRASHHRRKSDVLTPHSILLVDADYFKVVNDTYGHPFGDQILVRLAQILRGNAKRDQDIAARFGGEEFCLLLPHTTADEATIIAERIRTAVSSDERIIEQLWSSETIDGSPHKPNLTVSIGVAELDLTKTFRENHHNVDTALYAAKQIGRDTVTVFESPPAV